MVAAAFALAAAFAVALLFGQHPLLFRLTTGLWVVVFLGFFVIYCPIKYNRLKKDLKKLKKVLDKSKTT